MQVQIKLIQNRNKLLWFQKGKDMLICAIALRERWMTYHNRWNGCVLRTTHYSFFPKFRSQILVQKTVEFVKQCEEFLFGVESHSLTENTSNNSIKQSGKQFIKSKLKTL